VLLPAEALARKRKRSEDTTVGWDETAQIGDGALYERERVFFDLDLTTAESFDKTVILPHWSADLQESTTAFTGMCAAVKEVREWGLQEALHQLGDRHRFWAKQRPGLKAARVGKEDALQSPVLDASPFPDAPADGPIGKIEPFSTHSAHSSTQNESRSTPYAKIASPVSGGLQAGGASSVDAQEGSAPMARGTPFARLGGKHGTDPLAIGGAARGLPASSSVQSVASASSFNSAFTTIAAHSNTPGASPGALTPRDFNDGTPKTLTISQPLTPGVLSIRSAMAPGSPNHSGRAPMSTTSVSSGRPIHGLADIIAGEQEESALARVGYSARTERMGRYLSKKFEEKPEQDLCYQELCTNDTSGNRQAIAGAFFELLVLKTNGVIDLQQEHPEQFSDIRISKGAEWA